MKKYTNISRTCKTLKKNKVILHNLEKPEEVEAMKVLDELQVDAVDSFGMIDSRMDLEIAEKT